MLRRKEVGSCGAVVSRAPSLYKTSDQGTTRVSDGWIQTYHPGYLGDFGLIITRGEPQQLDSHTFPFPVPFPQVSVCSFRKQYPIVDLQLFADKARLG
jgi:hypothetical protein